MLKLTSIEFQIKLKRVCPETPTDKADVTMKDLLFKLGTQRTSKVHIQPSYYGHSFDKKKVCTRQCNQTVAAPKRPKSFEI